MNNDKPIYLSKRMFRNLWQRYAIYSDRLELTSWFFFSKIKIPIKEIVSVEKNPRNLKSLRWSLIILDFASIFECVEIKKNTGFFKIIRFVPSNIDVFIYKIKDLINKL